MRVLVIHNTGRSDLPSGETIAIESETAGLRRAGVDVLQEVVSNDQAMASFWGRAQTALNLAWSLPARRWVIRLLDRVKPDLVHFHGVLPLLTPSVFHACRERGLPVVQTLHNFRWLCLEGGLFRDGRYCVDCLASGPACGVKYRCARSSWAASVCLFLVNKIYVQSRLLNRWVSRFIAVSQFVRDIHVEAGFLPAKIEVKYNGLGLNQMPAPLPWKQRQGVTYVGRLSAGKGSATLAALMERIRQPLNFVGDGPELPALRQKAGRLARSDVFFHGRLPANRVHEIMAKSRCVVVPSVCGETFSLAAAEAMACGTPVVAYDLGGVAELVRQGGGLLAQPSDLRQFAGHVEKLTGQPGLAEELGNKGQRFARTELSLTKTTSRLMDIYETVLSAGDISEG